MANTKVELRIMIPLVLMLAQSIPALGNNYVLAPSNEICSDGAGTVITSEADCSAPTVAPSTVSGFYNEEVISTLCTGAKSAIAADMDGDGDMDVLPQVISTLADGPKSAYAADVDGDGDLDVVSASANDDKIAWFTNDGSGGFGSLQVISTLANSARTVYVVDVDGDGDIDVLSASKIDNKIAWPEPPFRPVT
ncbi:hypothetical protein CYMTET_53278 [Cymbomonas tetramitiformis]|uniref:VCBS repeat-containing protein n=1 Tax=Cymbomonas tetramitiformis TaxID=36881 RepID=A0AAE0BJ37_9CHLO|nr:hypothetical protein CYMTET_53278 [Cymbomonas tetramitiformis]